MLVHTLLTVLISRAYPLTSTQVITALFRITFMLVHTLLGTRNLVRRIYIIWYITRNLVRRNLVLVTWCVLLGTSYLQ